MLITPQDTKIPQVSDVLQRLIAHTMIGIISFYLFASEGVAHAT